MKEKHKRQPTRIMTPQEFEGLLRAATPEILPAIVLGGFCFLRNGEILLTDWSAIDFKQRTIRIESGTKTSRPRSAPLPDGAIEWLRPIARVAGRVVPCKSRSALSVALSAARSAVGINRNVLDLRSSALGYTFAMNRDAEGTSNEAGISAPQLIDHHAQPLRENAETWFSIFPPEKWGTSSTEDRKTAE